MGPGEEHLSRNTLVRWLLRGVLSVAAVVLTGIFIWVVFIWPRKLPLHVISVSDMRAEELRENLLGQNERAAWLDVNSANLAVTPADPEAGEAWQQLENLVRENGTIRTWQVPLKSNQGPGRNLFAVYVSAVAVARPNPARLGATPENSDGVAADEQPRDLWLVPRSGLPWSADGPESWTSGLVRLDDLLHCVARSVDREGSHAWLILDLRQPANPNGVDTLDCQWKTQLQTALEKLKKAENGAVLAERLIVTLACDDGQQNWLAPEAGGTFFGFWLKRGLSGGFDGAPTAWPFQTLSLKQFREELERRVRETVAIRRHATQVPVWLPEPDERLAALPLVRIAGTSPAVARPVTALAERFAKIDSLWKQLDDKPAAPWRWDPVGTAVAEHRLVALESLALGDGSGFDEGHASAVEAINALRPLPAPPGVSLVEQRLHLEHVGGKDASQALQQLAAWADLSEAECAALIWPPPAPVAPPEGSPPAQATRTVPEPLRPAVVWSTLVRQARNGAYQRFAEPDLRTALSFAGASAASAEMQLVRLLCDEVEWSATGVPEARARGVGRAALALDLLQRIASAQPAPAALQARGDLAGIEARFLSAFDRLLAGQFERADRELDAVCQELVVLHGLVQGLAAAMQTRDEVFRAVPHLLEWSLAQRQYRPAAAGAASAADRLETLAGAWELALRLDDTRLKTLVWASVNGQPPAEIAGLRTSLEGLKSALSDSAREVTGEVNDPLSLARTFREQLQLLRTPLLPVADREALHRLVQKYLLADANGWLVAAGTASTSDLGQYPRWSAGATAFVSHLQQDLSKAWWRSVLSGELQYRLGATGLADRLFPLPADAVRQDASVAQQMELDRQARTARVAAGVFAGVESLQRNLLGRADLPWSSALRASSLAHIRQFDLQRHRLLVAGWGDETGTGSGGGEPLCVRLAGRYSTANGDAGLAGLAGEIDQAWSAARDALVARLQQLGIRPAAGPQDVQLGSEPTVASWLDGAIALDAAGEAWTGSVADVKYRDGQKYLRVQSPDGDSPGDDRFALPDQLAIPLATGPAGATIDLEVNPADWTGSTPPEVLLAWRGHRRSAPVVWTRVSRQRKTYELNPSPRENRDARITVVPPPRPIQLNVILLIDCSTSTTTSVQLTEGDAAGTSRMLGDELKDTAARFMQLLKDQHTERQRDIRFAIMPFGYRLGPEEAPGILRGRDGVTAPAAGETIFCSGLRSLDATWFNQLTGQVRRLEVKDRSDTPLYSALRCAIDALRDEPGTSLVCVLSDGVNQPSANAPIRDRAVIDEVRSDLAAARNVKVRIFFFDVFTRYIDQAIEEWIAEQPDQRRVQEGDGDSVIRSKAAMQQETRRGLESTYQRGMGELQEFAGAEKPQVKFEAAESNGFEKLKQAFLEVIPAPRLTATLIRTRDGVEQVDMTLAAERQASGDELFVIARDKTPCRAEVFFVSGIENEEGGDTSADGSSRPVDGGRIPVRGGEQLMLDLARDGERFVLIQRPFGETTGNLDFRPVGELAGNAAGMAVHSWRSGLQPDGLGLKYRVGFERTDRTWCERPGFFLLQVQTTRPAKRTLLTPDFDYLAGQHYPVAELDALAGVEAHDPAARIWWAVSIPACARELTVPGGAFSDAEMAGVEDQARAVARELGSGPESAHISVRRSKGEITVTVRYLVEPADHQRLVVFCPAAAAVKRTLEEEVTPETGLHRLLSETAVFRLPEDGEASAAALRLVTTEALDQMLREQPDALWSFSPGGR